MFFRRPDLRMSTPIKFHWREDQKGRPPRLAEAMAQRLHRDYVLHEKAPSAMPAQRELATLYGVSRSTIRAALQILERVGKIRRSTGHSSRVIASPSKHAPSLVGKQIGCSFGNSPNKLSDPFRRKMLESMLSRFRVTGLDLLWVSSSWKLSPACGPADHLNIPTVLGVFLFGRHPTHILESFKTLEKPLVVIDANETGNGMDSICLDNAHGSRLLARRLHKLGHRRVVGIFESPKKPVDQQDDAWALRRDAFVAEWKVLTGRPPRPLYIADRARFGTSLSELVLLLKRPAKERPTAVCVPNVQYMDPILTLAGAMGIQVPKDLSIVGFKSADQESPMTSICFNGMELGYAATTHMEKLIHRSRQRERRTLLKKIKGTYTAGTSHARAPND